MDDLVLIRPNLEYKKQAIEYVQEFIDYDSIIYGSSGLKRYLNNYEEWLNKLDEYRNMKVTFKKVPSDTFFLIRLSDNKLIGIITIRFLLNASLLEHGGHIGYSIRPTERNKGYATKQLYLALKQCYDIGMDKVLITCDSTNIASSKVIEKMYGSLQNEVYDSIDKIYTKRYWIDVLYSLEKFELAKSKKM